MATLWDQLNQLYGEVLPRNPEEAINGTKLLGLIVEKLDGRYAANSIRQHFSEMSKDPTSSIAKVTVGQGYYLRQQPETENIISSSSPLEEDTTAICEPPGGRDVQSEEKFRSIFIRYSERSSTFPMHVDHTRASTRAAAGVNKWKFPDVVLLNWEVGEMTDQGYRLDPNLLRVKMGLGEQPFVLRSVELKVSLTLSSFRESFFQCVSNSKWAHAATLAIATSIDDSTLHDELRRLGASYDVAVDTYGLPNGFLESIPSAQQIQNMDDSEFEENIVAKISLRRISTGKERASLDWDHIRDMRKLSPEFRQLFDWVAHCLEQSRPYTIADYKRIQEIENRVG